MGRPKILLTRQWPNAVVDHLSARYGVTIDPQNRALERDQLIDAMCAFDAICPTITDTLDAGVLLTGHARTRLLCNFGAGLDHVDLNAAKQAGLVVTNTPDVLTQSTAELAILLMLMLSRRVGEGEHELRSGRWRGWHPTHLLGHSLSGKLLALIGFGRIARATAEIAASAFGMRIAYHSRNRGDLPESLRHAEYYGDLDTLLVEADVVSLHCPGGEATHHLIDGDRLALCKSSALIINTARGTIIDEAALADALKTGKIAGAGLDVYEREPQINPQLVDCQNAVLLPHLGSATMETRTAMGMRAAANLDAFFAGQTPPDRVV